MKVVASILVFLILSSGCIEKQEERKTALKVDIIFQNNCAGCHGQGGSGGTGIAPPLKGSNFIKNASEHEIKNVIENGRGYDVKR